MGAERSEDAARTRRLVRAWLALAVGAIGLSTLLSFVLVAARTPGLSELAGLESNFRVALVLHVNLAALVWFLAIGSVLWSRLADAGRPRWMPLRWTGYGLALAGVAAMVAAPLADPGPALLTNYVPVLDSRLFLAGLTWFVIGALLSAAVALLPGGAVRTGASGFGLRLAALALLAAGVSMVWGAAQLGGDLARSAWFELTTWGPGHIGQGAFTLLMLVAWMELARAGGLVPGRGLRAILLLGLLPALLGLALHLFLAPDTADFRKAHTLLMAFGTWPAPLAAVAMLLTARREGTALSGARTALWLSVLLFAAGCVVGAFIRTDNTMIPAHYHGTIGAVTLAFMGLAFLEVRRLGLRCPPAAWVVRQSVAYGAGLLLMVAGLAWAGLLGAARKTPLADDAVLAAERLFAHGLIGFGGAIAIAAALVFVALVVRALLAPADAAPANSAAPALPGAAQPAQGPRRRGDGRPLAIGLALISIAGLGLVISSVPSGVGPRQAIDHLLSGFHAVDKLSHVAERRREEVDTRFKQGVIMLHAKQYEFAIAAFHRVLEIAPEMPEAHVNLGFALAGLSRWTEARAFFESATALRPEQANAYYGLAMSFEGQGDLQMAIGAMRTYIHLAPPDDGYRRKAEAALWEWESAVARERAAAGGAADGGRRP